MEGVTLKQFNDWVDKNKHNTWYIGKEGGFWPEPEHHAYIKYFDLSFDTRDMKIFAIQVRGWLNFEIYTANEYRDEPGNLLDLLERKMKEEITKMNQEK